MTHQSQKLQYHEYQARDILWHGFSCLGLGWVSTLARHVSALSQTSMSHLGSYPRLSLFVIAECLLCA